MEKIVYKNNLFNLTRFVRTLPNMYKLIQSFSYELGTEHEDLLYQLFDELYSKNLTNVKVNKFVDICAAPGVYSKYLLDKYPKAIGTGISLNPEKGGHEFKIPESNRYEEIYQDIFQITSNDRFDGDMFMASCIPYNVSAKTSDEYQIIFQSLMICLNSLEEGGTLIINFSFKEIIFAINFVYLISIMFDRIRLFKSTKLWIMQRTFYVIGYEYHKNDQIINRINSYLNDFDNFYEKYRKNLLPEINRNILNNIIKMFENNVFLPQIKTFIYLSTKDQ